MTDQDQTASTGRVTIDDVRTALGDTNPNQTNASKIRALLGRGSFETIQKHLSTLRQELATAALPPVAPGAVPAIPVDVAQQLWLTAWAAAQLATFAKVEKLAAERDAALLKLDTINQDLTGFVATVDEQATQLEQLQTDKETAEVKLDTAINTLERTQDEQALALELLSNERAKFQAETAAEIEKLKSDADIKKMIFISDLEKAKTSAQAEIDAIKSDASHKEELASKFKEMMQIEMARLNEQIGELKSHLYQRAATQITTQLP